MTYNCADCGQAMKQAPEKDEAGEWIMHCFSCGARNIIIPVFKLARWR